MLLLVHAIMKKRILILTENSANQIYSNKLGIDNNTNEKKKNIYIYIYIELLLLKKVSNCSPKIYLKTIIANQGKL